MQDPQTCTFSPIATIHLLTWPLADPSRNISCPSATFGVPACRSRGTCRGAPDRPIFKHSISIGGLSHLTSCLALWMRPDLDAHRNLLLKQLFPHYPPSKRHKETDNGSWSCWVIGRLARYSWSSHSEIVINGRPTIDNEQYHLVLQAWGWNYCVRFTNVKSINMRARLSTHVSRWQSMMSILTNRFLPGTSSKSL